MNEPTTDPTIAGHFVSPQRRRLAEAARHLIDATLTIEDATEEQLGTASDMVEAAARHLGREPHDDDRGVRQRFELGHSDYLPRSPLVGDVSPLAPPMQWTTTADGVEVRGQYHAAYEGPPGYVHGGWIALTFDEVLGITNISSGNPGMTGRLTVRYLKPTPLHRPVEIRGRTERVQGRRIVATAEMHVDGVRTAVAEGLFLTIDPRLASEYFGGTASTDESTDPSTDPSPSATDAPN
jgi:acyl-coenzyme A thioesterase PaaI-like protein